MRTAYGILIKKMKSRKLYSILITYLLIYESIIIIFISKNDSNILNSNKEKCFIGLY